MNQAEKDLIRCTAVAYAETEEPAVLGELERVFDATYGLLTEPGEEVVRWSHGRLQADSPFREMSPGATIIFITTELVRALNREGAEHRVAEIVAQLGDYTGHPRCAEGVAKLLLSTAPPVDLEIRVTTPWGDDRRKILAYDLSSPSGATDHHHAVFRSESLHSPEGFLGDLFERLEKLRQGLTIDGERILTKDVEYELALLGLDLYRQLFPSELRRVLRELQGPVETVLITSDEPWIPWELLKSKDTDFFAVEFQLTRWLAGAPRPKELVRVSRLACFEVAKAAESRELPDTAKERELLSRLAGEAVGVADRSPEAATFPALKALLENGEVDLLHFAGHGEYNRNDPDDSRFFLADRSFHARELLAVESQVRKVRPLVFLNACHGTRQGQSLTGLGGWARRWVHGCGCGGFLGPMWSVRDALAHRFAEVFYGQLKEGRTFGEAVRSARRTTREEYPGSLGWLAYAVYAHPNGRMDLGSSLHGLMERRVEA